MSRRIADFQTIRSEGGLLPPDLLRRVLDPAAKLEGTRPEDFGLSAGERLNEAITQSWNRLHKHWAEFSAAAAGLPAGEPGTGLTNDRWNLPLLRELGFGFLPTAAGPEIGGRTFAINRFYGPVPVHLVGRGLDLDKRAAGVRGAASAAPHGLAQELLNRSPDYLWAIVSNGLRFRVLRDNQALSRQSFLEFDLEAMFTGEVYSDFVLLWLIAHATRFAPRDGGGLETCWLEQRMREAQDQGTRALGDLRGGVERALQTLGQGLTSHPKNAALREALRSGRLPLADFHGQLLRVIYRLIFLFVAEDRAIEGVPLLHPRDSSEAGRLARERYAEHYSTGRLRHLASAIKGSRHGDLWRQFQLLVGALSGDPAFATARERLALPALGSFLWSPDSTAALNEAELTNHDLLEALRNLAFTRQGKVLRPVDYRNLGAEELGGVYEGLLALTPQIGSDGAHFTFAEFAGNERKTSGSYYTPDSLVQCLLDTALDPVVAEAILGKTGAAAEKAILDLKVCDPAVGSGHFLVGAAHRLARHLARVRALAQGDSEPSPLLYQHALRDVIGRCLYGVDINPMAAELCRVSLWLEALEPGKPLSFLEHHIRVGNSLLGATPELTAAGIPDVAFVPIEGDDSRACTLLRKRNKASLTKGLGPLFAQQDAVMQFRLALAAAALAALPDDRQEEIRAKEAALKVLEDTDEYRKKKLLADLWCAAFVVKKHFSDPGRDSSVFGITQSQLFDVAESRTLASDVAREVARLSDQYHFFHWHLAFPEVFALGGFDCVLGNPPWERVKLQEKEWFAERNGVIAKAPSSSQRKKLIEALKLENPSLSRLFMEDSRKAEGDSHLLRNSGRYPLCGRGDINLYAVFAEAMRRLLNQRGRLGCVLPTGIATDDTTKSFFQDLIESKSLASLFSFENEELVFPGIHHATRFCLVTLGSGQTQIVETAQFVFYARRIEHVRDPERLFGLSSADIELLNPNTLTCPIFRSRHDAELAKAIYRRVPALIREARAGKVEDNPWGIQFSTMFHMSNDSHLFRTRAQLEAEGWRINGNRFYKDDQAYIPLYEAKMIHHFDHRWGTYEGQTEAQSNQGKLPELDDRQHEDPEYFALPHEWVSSAEVNLKTNGHVGPRWTLGFRGITGATVVRTLISCVLPDVALGNSLPSIDVDDAYKRWGGLLSATLNSFVVDFCSRFKIGGSNLNFFIFRQFPIVAPTRFGEACRWCSSHDAARDWLMPRILELTYTAFDLEPFAKECGWFGPPFRWDKLRRFMLRCELDAAFFHLYLSPDDDGHWQKTEQESEEVLIRLKASFPTPRDAVVYIMDTFPIVRQRDEESHIGDYCTKRVILEIYDAMQEAIRTGQPYQTRLDPPPADPRCCHPAREES